MFFSTWVFLWHQMVLFVLSPNTVKKVRWMKWQENKVDHNCSKRNENKKKKMRIEGEERKKEGESVVVCLLLLVLLLFVMLPHQLCFLLKFHSIIFVFQRFSVYEFDGNRTFSPFSSKVIIIMNDQMNQSVNQSMNQSIEAIYQSNHSNEWIDIWKEDWTRSIRRSVEVSNPHMSGICK